MLTQTNLTGLFLYSLRTSFSARNSLLHGAHQVAPNETSTTLPRKSARSATLPSKLCNLKVGFGLAAFCALVAAHIAPATVSTAIKRTRRVTLAIIFKVQFTSWLFPPARLLGGRRFVVAPLQCCHANDSKAAMDKLP